MGIIFNQSYMDFISEKYTLDLLNNYKYIEEAYFGEKPLENALLAFSKVRNKYIGKSVLSLPTAAADQDMFKFNREIEKVFGFYRFSIDLQNSNKLNAFTFPIGGRTNVGVVKNQIGISNTGSGVKFKDDHKMIGLVIVTWGLFSDKNFTNREVFALLLHEIGHNFSTALIKNGGLIEAIRLESNESYKILYPILGLLNGKLWSSVGDNDKAKMYAETKEKLIEESPQIYKAMITIRQLVIPVIKKILYACSLFFYVKIIRRYISEAESINNMTSYEKNEILTKYMHKDEQVSDAFASMYGFGSDLSSAFLKMSLQRGIKSNKGINTIGTTAAIIFDMITIPLLVQNGINDCHLDNLSRAKSQMNYVKYELENNKSMDPLMKIELQNQYNNIEKQVEDFIKLNTHKDGKDIIRTYNIMMSDRFGDSFERYKRDSRDFLKYTNDQISKMKSV